MGRADASVEFRDPQLGSYMQTPIVLGDKLWSCDWRGTLSCLDPATGRISYTEPLGKAGQAFTSSVIAAGNQLYLENESGEVYVVEASSKFTLVATNQLGGLCLATPAAADGTLFFRTAEKLIAVGTR